MKILKWISQVMAALVCVFVVSCESKKEEKNEKNVIGQYLYLVDNHVLHTTKDCIELLIAKDENGHRVSGMQFIDTLSILPENGYSYCKHCFDDECYQHAQEIMERNLEVLSLDTINKYE